MKKFSKARLERSRDLFLIPRVDTALNSALRRLDDGDMITLVSIIANGVDSPIEHHIINNCANAEDEDTRIKCITDAQNIKIRTINKIGESLVEKCGGKLFYLEENNK